MERILKEKDKHGKDVLASVSCVRGRVALYIFIAGLLAYKCISSQVKRVIRY